MARYLWSIGGVLVALLGLGSGFGFKPGKVLPIHQDALSTFDINNKPCVTKAISSDKVVLKGSFKANSARWLKQFIPCIQGAFLKQGSPKFILTASTLIPTNLSIKPFHFTRLKAFSMEATIPGALATFIGLLQIYFILGILAFKCEMYITSCSVKLLPVRLSFKHAQFLKSFSNSSLIT